MDNHSEGEWLGVSGIREIIDDLIFIVGGCVAGGSTEPVSEVGQGLNQVDGIRDERIVWKLATLVEVGLVDKVPVCLEAVGAFDVISEGCALNEGMVNFSCNKTGVWLLENVELIKSSCQNWRVLGLKNFLGSESD